MAPLFSRARLHINTAVAYVVHLTTQLEVSSMLYLLQRENLVASGMYMYVA